MFQRCGADCEVKSARLNELLEVDEEDDQEDVVELSVVLLQESSCEFCE